MMRPSPLLNHVLAIQSKDVKRLILLGCWRHWNALMRSCKALYALIAPLVADRAWWRALVKSELRPLLVRDGAWSAEMCDQALAQFDPFFDAWPADMPARVPAKHGEKLSWLFDRHLIRISDTRLASQVVTTERYIWIRDWPMRRRWTWSWRPSVFLIGHTWTQSIFDWEGDHWYGYNNGVEHLCYHLDRLPVIFHVKKAGCVFWSHQRMAQNDAEHGGQVFHGYCEQTYVQPLPGAFEWRSE